MIASLCKRGITGRPQENWPVYCMGKTKSAVACLAQTVLLMAYSTRS